MRAWDDQTYNVLFLCTGNSARSIIAESVLNRLGKGRFRAFSAGSYPRPATDPMVLEELDRHDFPTNGARSKDWDEFATEDSPRMDFVITVCDKARGEVCPIWPGRPIAAHWGMEDPHAFEGSDEDRRCLVRRLIREMEYRIDIMTNLPLASLDALSVKAHLDRIGRDTRG